MTYANNKNVQLTLDCEAVISAVKISVQVSYFVTLAAGRDKTEPK